MVQRGVADTIVEEQLWGRGRGVTLWKVTLRLTFSSFFLAPTFFFPAFSSVLFVSSFFFCKGRIKGSAAILWGFYPLSLNRRPFLASGKPSFSTNTLEPLVPSLSLGLWTTLACIPGICDKIPKGPQISKSWLPCSY
jgi:hypothetical protein